MTSYKTWMRHHLGKTVLVALLATPAIVATVHKTSQTGENRHLAAAPKLPDNWDSFLALPGQTDAWIKDHFGFRQALIKGNNALRYHLFGEFPTIQMASGRNGRTFLAAHGTNVEPYSALTVSCVGDKRGLTDFRDYLNRMFDDFAAQGMHPKLMIVPSAPAVYQEDVPAWLYDQCNRTNLPTQQLIDDPALSARARESMYFPLAEMRAIKNPAALFPKSWFHWAGPGLEKVAADSVSRLFPQMPAPGAPLQRVTYYWNSDVGYLFPGVKLKNDVVVPNLPASNIKECVGKQCFPEFAEFADLVDDTTRFENPAAPARRLLIISDSFGSKVSGWYARHYGTVEQVATNNIGRLTLPQVLKMREVLFRDPANTDIIFLYHDAGLYGTVRLGLQRLHGDGSAPWSPY